MGFFSFLHVFTDLFNSAERAWEKLEPAIQTALLQGTGIISIINQNLETTPPELLQLIAGKFPSLSQQNLENALNKAQNVIGIVQGTATLSLEETLSNVQLYLKTKQGTLWENASSILGQTLSVAFAPDETPFAKISMLAEIALEHFKKQ